MLRSILVREADDEWMEVLGTRMSREDAIKLAAEIVFLADGNLVRVNTDTGPKHWNTDSRFHQAYATIMRSK